MRPQLPREHAQTTHRHRHRPFQQQVNLPSSSLTDDSIPHLLNLPSLTTIIAIDNKFTSIESLTKLSALKDLEEIDLNNNPVCEHPEFPKAVFEAVESLQVANKTDREGNVIE